MWRIAHMWQANATCVTVPTDLMRPICTSAADGLRSPKTGPPPPRPARHSRVCECVSETNAHLCKNVIILISTALILFQPIAQHTAAAGVSSSWQSSRWIRDPIQLCDLGDTSCSNFPISSWPSTQHCRRRGLWKPRLCCLAPGLIQHRGDYTFFSFFFYELYFILDSTANYRSACLCNVTSTMFNLSNAAHHSVNAIAKVKHGNGRIILWDYFYLAATARILKADWKMGGARIKKPVGVRKGLQTDEGLPSSSTMTLKKQLEMQWHGVDLWFSNCLSTQKKLCH